MNIAILTVPHISSSLAFTPIMVNKNLLNENNIDFKVYYQETKAIYDSDLVILDGRFYRKLQSSDPDTEILELLERLSSNIPKIIWFDTTDGTGTTQFQFLPYVNKYLKIQVLKDRTLYQKKYYGGRIYTEYYHSEFGVNDKKELASPRPATQDQIHKIDCAWGHGLADFGRWGPMMRRIRKFVPLPYYYSQNFRVHSDRSVIASFRFSTNYKRETIAFQRSLVKQTANKLGYPTDKIPRNKYLYELRNCKLGISPFGWGEPSYKDFEIILNGAALIKPDLSHLETWPNLYINNETYLSFDWDCSNLEEVIDHALTNNLWQEITNSAKNKYEYYLFNEAGKQEFVKRFIETFIDNNTDTNHQTQPNNTKIGTHRT